MHHGITCTTSSYGLHICTRFTAWEGVPGRLHVQCITHTAVSTRTPHTARVSAHDESGHVHLRRVNGPCPGEGHCEAGHYTWCPPSRLFILSCQADASGQYENTFLSWMMGYIERVTRMAIVLSDCGAVLAVHWQAACTGSDLLGRLG
jgi:hypothetical protein